MGEIKLDLDQSLSLAARTSKSPALRAIGALSAAILLMHRPPEDAGFEELKILDQLIDTAADALGSLHGKISGGT